MPTHAVRWPTDSPGGLDDRRCVSWSGSRVRHGHAIRHPATRRFGAPARVVLVARAARAARAATRPPHRNAATDADRALARPALSAGAAGKATRRIVAIQWQNPEKRA